MGESDKNPTQYHYKHFVKKLISELKNNYFSFPIALDPKFLDFPISRLEIQRIVPALLGSSIAESIDRPKGCRDRREREEIGIQTILPFGQKS
jgi:hypothetical protein